MNDEVYISIRKKNPSADYAALDKFLGKLDHRSSFSDEHYVARIDTSQSAQAIRDSIEPFLHPGDRCFVGRLLEWASSPGKNT